MSEKYVESNRDQLSLLPYDLREWIPEDDLVHFVIEAVEGIPVSEFSVNDRGTGSAQYHPHMMLSLLIYCYANGIFGSRRIERATYRDIAVRYVCANVHPDHDTICKFRRENFEAVGTAFLHVLRLARELKLLRVGTISVDGTKIKANASKDKNVRYDRAGALERQLTIDIATLLRKAEEADSDQEIDGQKLPEAVSRREKLRKKMEEARAKLEKRARDRAATERAAYEAKVARRETRTGRRKGKIIQRPESVPRDDEQINLTDSDSRLMRKNKQSGYEQAYNAQASVDAEGSQLILGARVSQCASDRNELQEDVRSIPSEIGKATRVLADNGYASGDEVEALEKENIEVLVSVHSESKEHPRTYDFRPPCRIKSKESKETPQARAWIKRMAKKLESEEAKKHYRLRKQTVEPVFGIIKQAIGFRQFLLRGKEKVAGEWMLVATAYNFKRLFSLATL